MCRKFRELKAEEIDVRIGQTIKSQNWEGVTLLLYKNARVDMDILDETVGPPNWQRKHEVINENLYCHVGVWCEEKKDWVWKSDCGVESNTEKEKGEASDAFKRACVNWGIGRELYSAPKGMMVTCELDQTGKKPKDKKTKFYVSDIQYENRKIVSLSIVDQNGEVAYTYPKSSCKKPSQTSNVKPIQSKEKKQDFQPITKTELIGVYGVQAPEKTITWLEGKLGKELANFNEKDTAWARQQLEEAKAERDKKKAEERKKARLDRISDDDIPFPMED